MIVDEIIAGQEYVFSIEGNEARIRDYGLWPDKLREYEGHVVMVKKKTLAGSRQRVWIENTPGISIAGYWPPVCFKPTKVTFVVGEEYICDHKANMDGPGRYNGWCQNMTDRIGQVLVCRSITRHGCGRLSPDGDHHPYVYSPEHVRPVGRSKRPLVIKRNVLNFWPGTEKPEKLEKGENDD